MIIGITFFEIVRNINYERKVSKDQQKLFIQSMNFQNYSY